MSNNWLCFIVLFILFACERKSKLNYYLSESSSPKGVYVNYVLKEDYILIGQMQDGILNGRFIEIFNLSHKNPDTAYGFCLTIGNIEKRLSFFNADNAFIELKDKGHNSFPEFIQIENGVPTTNSLFINISYRDEGYYFVPQYSMEIDSLVFKWNQNVIAASHEKGIFLERNIVKDSVSKKPLELEIWTSVPNTNKQLYDLVTIKLVYDRIIFFEALQEIPDSLRNNSSKYFLGPNIREKVSGHIKKRQSG